jgi:invasion protein IalB
MVCRTTISGTFETGQSAVRIDLIEREGEGAARLQLFLPVGLYLQAGVKITADQGTPHLVPYVWCLTNTCIAADRVDAKLIKEMESGQKLLLEVVDSSVLTVSTSVPLNQFAAVRQAPPTQVFEQAIDE